MTKYKSMLRFLVLPFILLVLFDEVSRPGLMKLAIYLCFQDICNFLIPLIKILKFMKTTFICLI